MPRKGWSLALLAGGHLLFRAICLVLLLAALAGAQLPAQPDSGLTTEQLQTAQQQLREALAAPHERAFVQVLTDVQVLRDPTDSTAVYDIVARFDPERYRDPHLGRYPLTFEDQFVLWGKRVALYTLFIPWKSGNFYLHDIATGRQAWIAVEAARRLYPPPAKPPAGKPFAQWLKFIQSAEPGTEPRSLSLWRRLMREESRDLVLHRLQAPADSGMGAADSLATGGGR